MTVRWFQVHY